MNVVLGSVKGLVYRVLREDVRARDDREYLIRRVKELCGEGVSSESVTRSARFWQNTKGLFLASGKVREKRVEMVDFYKEEFRR